MGSKVSSPFKEVIETHDVGSRPIELHCEMPFDKAVQLQHDESGKIFMLAGVDWIDGKATIRLQPGRGVIERIDICDGRNKAFRIASGDCQVVIEGKDT